MSKLLTKDQVETQLGNVANWQIDQNGKTIFREYKTKNFVEAVEFINKVKDLAQQADHHPDLHLTGYRNLRIDLSTHSVGGLSEKDFQLAEQINKLPIELKR